MCPAGFACPGGSIITPCDGILTFSLGNQSTCTNCKSCNAGTYKSTDCSSTEDITCTPCPAGSACPDGILINLCSAGTTFSVGGQSVCSSCSACLPGTWESYPCTTTNNRECSFCPPGYFCSGGLAIDLCANGLTFSLGNQSTCTNCEICSAGTYQTTSCISTRNRVCSPCPPGFACPGGTTLLDPMGSTACVSGVTFSVGLQSTCTACTTCLAGTYENVSCTASRNRVCLPCPPGFACPGGTVITPCILGSTYSLGSQSTCTSCTVCINGLFETTACSATTNRICSLSPCSPGTYSVSVGYTTQCNPCPAGYACPGGTVLDECIAGSTFSMGGQGACTPCLTPCGAGTYELQTCTPYQNRVCDTCLDLVDNGMWDGRFAAGYSPYDCPWTCMPGYELYSGACSLCPEGSYCEFGLYYDCPYMSWSSVGSGQATDCVCEPGFYGVNGQTCDPCPANFYCTGGQAITPCPANSVSFTEGADLSACHCVPGYKSTFDGEPCLPCATENFCLGGTLQQACRTCTAGDNRANRARAYKNHASTPCPRFFF
jgi:hypothetical protein